MKNGGIFHDERLRCYPAQIAEALWGTHDTTTIVAKVKEFARSYDDTEDLMDTIGKLVKVSVQASPLPCTQANQRIIYKDLDAFAFESVGANHNWYSAKGEYSPAVVFVWVSRLCLCTTTPDHGGWGAGFDSSRWGLACYCLAAAPTSSVVHIIAEMCRTYAATSSWRAAFDVLQLYACAAERSGCEHELEACMQKMLDSRPQTEELKQVIEEWWNSTEKTLSRFAVRRLCDIKEFLPSGTSSTVFDDLARADKRVEQFVRAIACSCL